MVCGGENNPDYFLLKRGLDSSRNRITVASCLSSPRGLVAAVSLILFLLATPARAHVGSPSVFFEGKAGPYPLHVVIRPAEVVPGLAEISVRVDASHIQNVTALPIKWNAGRKGAPPPEVARLVRGETNLYNTQLWFMESGSQSVEIQVTGSAGPGQVTIPVDAVARRVLGMPKALGTMLAILGIALVSMLLSLIGAAVRESVLAPGTEPARRRIWGASAAVVIGAVLLAVTLWGGRRWWNAESADYRNNRLYEPMEATARVRTENGQRILRLEVLDRRFASASPIVPDHGKLMHMFLMREPGLDAFAHLHPLKRDRKTFESALPPLPAGKYKVYADITYETGFSDTLIASADVPETSAHSDGQANPGLFDADDSWRIDAASGAGARNQTCQLATNYTMTWHAPTRFAVNEPIVLRFTVDESSGKQVEFEPYLGMRGHMALRRDDGSVFTHLHPGGSASMASMQLATLRTEGKLPLNAAFGAEDPICKLPAASSSDEAWLAGNTSADPATVTFPYAFPRTGRYRLWVQVKIKGEVLTGVYDLEVGKSGSS